MLQRSNIVSSEEELQDFYAQLRTQHVTPAWIGGGVSVEPRSKAVPYIWHWRDLRPQAMRAAELVGTEQAERRVLRLHNPELAGGKQTVRRLLELQPCRKANGTPPARAPALQESKRYAACSSSSPAGFCFPAFPSRAWRLGKLQRSCPCHGSPWCALVRVLAPHRTRRATLVPTARQQGVEGEAASRGAARWHWARRRQRGWALALAPGPVWQAGTRRRIAAIAHGPGIQTTRCSPTAQHPRACLPSPLRVGLSLETPQPLGGRVAGVVGRGASARSDGGLRAWHAAPRRAAGAVADPAPGRSWPVSRWRVPGRHRGKPALKFLSTIHLTTTTETRGASSTATEAAPAMAIKIGVDTGGTFSDFMLMDGDTLVIHKVLSTPENPARAVLQGLRHLRPDLTGVDVVHGSTVATNTLLERKGARTALITTQGFEDILEIGRQTRPHLYDPFVRKQPPLVPARLRFGVAERLAYNGDVLTPLTEQEIATVLERVRRSGAQSLAICLLHAYANPVHEALLTRLAVHLGIPVSASHQILPEFREYERCSTTVVNAYLRPVMQRYLQTLATELQGARLSVMRSNGGVMSAARAHQEAVHTVLSGPAGGVVGAFRVARDAGYTRAITFDMGGTSTDVSLCDEQPRTTNETVVASCPVKIPVLDIHTVGAGGGSLAYVDPGGALRVGPQSAGADPGPACYGKGTGLTVTDANLYLGRLHPDWFLGGQMQLDVARAKDAVTAFAHQVRMAPEAACEGILEVVNANMEGAIRVISVERGHDPREFVLVSFGGAGGMHAADLARRLSIPGVLVPANPGILSAFGMLITNYVQEYAHTVLVLATEFTPERAAAAFRDLEERGRQAMRDEGVAPQDVQISRFLDMCYVGQSFELVVPYRPNFIDEFHRRHDMRYGYEDSARPTQVVNVRMRVVGPSGTSYRTPSEGEQREEARAAQVDTMAMYVDGHWRQAPVYDRQRLHAGNGVAGPALITEYSATTVVPADFVARVDRQHNLVLRPATA